MIHHHQLLERNRETRHWSPEIVFSFFFLFPHNDTRIHYINILDAKGSRGVQCQLPVNYLGTLVREQGSTWKFSIDVWHPMSPIKREKESILSFDQLPMITTITTWPTASKSCDLPQCHDPLQMSPFWQLVLVRRLSSQWLRWGV